jgi:hypothetical protein
MNIVKNCRVSKGVTGGASMARNKDLSCHPKKECKKETRDHFESRKTMYI